MKKKSCEEMLKVFEATKGLPEMMKHTYGG